MKFYLNCCNNNGIFLEKDNISLKKAVNIISRLFLMNIKLTNRNFIRNIELCKILKEKFDFKSDLEEIEIKNLHFPILDTNLYNIKEVSEKNVIYRIDLYKVILRTNGDSEFIKDLEKEIAKDKKSNELYKILYELLKEHLKIDFEEHIKELEEVIKSDRLKKWFHPNEE